MVLLLQIVQIRIVGSCYWQFSFSGDQPCPVFFFSKALIAKQIVKINHNWVVMFAHVIDQKIQLNPLRGRNFICVSWFFLAFSFFFFVLHFTQGDAVTTVILFERLCRIFAISTHIFSLVPLPTCMQLRWPCVQPCFYHMLEVEYCIYIISPRRWLATTHGYGISWTIEEQ